MIIKFMGGSGSYGTVEKAICTHVIKNLPGTERFPPETREWYEILFVNKENHWAGELHLDWEELKALRDALENILTEER